MRRRTCTLLLSFLVVAWMSLPADAQRGGRGGDEGRRGGGFGGFGGRGGGGDFRERILSGMDTNGNGVIEPNEMQGRSSGLVQRMAQEAGLDMSRPLEIRRLLGSGGDFRGRGSWGRGRDDDDRRRGRDRDERDRGESSALSDLYIRVPRFGSEEIVGFGLHPRLLAGRIVNLEEEFDERILQFVERTVDRYDENGNSILDREEWEDVRWRDRDPKTADLDNDGRLTMAELAGLFSQDRDRGRDRGGNDRRRRGGDDDDRRRRGSGPGGGFGGPGGGFFGRGGDRDRGRDRDDDDDDDRGRRGRGRGGWGDPTAFLARLDRDGDGTISPDEVDERFAERLGERFGVDFSRDVSVEDLTNRLSGDGDRDRQQNEEQKLPEVMAAYKVNREADGRKSYRSARSPRGLPASLSNRDRNNDGQVTLSEFVGRASHDSVREFSKYDRNGDGIITADETSSSD